MSRANTTDSKNRNDIGFGNIPTLNTSSAILSMQLFASLAVLLGSVATVAAFVRLFQTWSSDAPKTEDWSIGFGLAFTMFGSASVAGGIGMLRLRQWGWWLMFGVIVTGLLIMTKGAALSIFGLMAAIWACRPLFGFPGPYSRLESHIDDIANSFRIDWQKTPLLRVSELLRSGQKAEAARIYRETSGCNWSEAHSAIARWDSDMVIRKLQYIAKVCKSFAS